MIENENSWLSSYVNTLISTQKIERTNESNEIKSIEMRDVKNVLEYAKKKYSENDDKKFGLQKELNEIDKTMNKLREDYKLLKPQQSKSKYQKKVIIQFAAKEACSFLLQLSYIIMGATWIPIYSVRVDTMNKDCKLNYQADIINNTGENWENILITLSSSKPQHGGQPRVLPLLEAYLVESQVEVVEISKTKEDKPSRKKGYKTSDKKNKKKESYDGDEDEDKEASESSDFSIEIAKVMSSEVHDTSSNAVFKIQRQTTIGSDNKPHKVTIAHIDLEIEFVHIVIPFINPNAYLKALAVNNSKYTLLPGKMHIFLDSVFVATASIKQTSPNENMELYLGVDINIKIEALPRKETSSTTGIFDKTKTESITRSCYIHNNKDEEIKLTMFYQLPKATDNKVKIKIMEPSESTLTEQNHVKYETIVKSRETEKVTFTFAIEYPDSKFLSYSQQFIS